jgi:hypothetical protein
MVVIFYTWNSLFLMTVCNPRGSLLKDSSCRKKRGADETIKFVSFAYQPVGLIWVAGVRSTEGGIIFTINHVDDLPPDRLGAIGDS